MFKTDTKCLKEIKTNDETNGFTIKCGSVNKFDPRVIYIKSRAKVTPTIERNDYSLCVSTVKAKFYEYLETFMPSYFQQIKEDYICTIEFSETSPRLGKISNLKYELYIVPLTTKPVNEHLELLNDITNGLNTRLKEIANTHCFQIVV